MSSFLLGIVLGWSLAKMLNNDLSKIRQFCVDLINLIKKGGDK